MSRSRILSQAFLQSHRMESYPYRRVERHSTEESTGEENLAGERPVSSLFSSSNEEEQRILAVEKQIFDRLNQAEHEAKEIRQRAYEEGFATGETSGKELGENQYRIYIERLEQHLSEMDQLRERLHQALEEECLALSLAVGEHLAAQHLETKPDAIKRLLERVIEELPFPLPTSRRASDGAVAVYLNPKDKDRLEHEEDIPGVRLLEDPGLGRGSLRLEAPQGILDVSMERRRARMMEVLERILEEDEPA